MKLFVVEHIFDNSHRKNKQNDLLEEFYTNMQVYLRGEGVRVRAHHVSDGENTLCD